MKDNDKTDRRIRKTKEALEEAILEILKEKTIHKVTVSEICQLADLNRSSFYRYYSDPMNLLESIETDFFETIASQWQDYETGKLMPGAGKYFIEKIYENREFCLILFGPHGNPQLLSQLLAFTYDNSIAYFENAQSETEDVNYDFIYTYVLRGSIGIVEKWILDGCRQPPEEISKLIEGLTTYGLSEFFHVN